MRSPLIQRLDRYVLGRFLFTYFVTLVFFLGLFLIMNIFAGLGKALKATERLEGAEYLKAVVGFYLTDIPFMFTQVAPFVTVTAAVVTVVRLRRANELVPIIAAGRSARRVILPIFLVAVVLAAGLVVAHDEVLPEVADSHRRCERLLRGRDASLFQELPHIVDGDGTVFRCRQYDADARALIGVSANDYRRHGRRYTLTAERMEWRSTGPEGRGWYLVGGKANVSRDEPRVGPVAEDRTIPEGERIRTDLKPRAIDVLVASKEGRGLSSTVLRRLIREHPSRTDLRLELHGRRAFAAANVVLLLIALPFAFRGSGRSTVLGAGLCIVICAAYFAFDTLVRDAAIRGALHPLIAAYSPTVLFAGIGAALFDGLPT